MVQYKADQFAEIAEKVSEKLGSIDGHKIFDINAFKVAMFEDEKAQRKYNKVRFT